MAPDRFLLIDDEPAIGALVRRVAEWCDYEVTVTTHADAFKQAYQELSPGLVGVDLAIPGVDGVELLRHLAEAGCKAKVLILSGFDRRTRETALRLGTALGLNMAGIIAKPMRIAELRSLLSEMRAS
jgi:DNA-binding response OmpR family regulator